MKDLIVNLATWRMFMNTTLQAAVHLRRKYAKNHIWDNHLKKNTRNRWFEINWTRRHYMEIDKFIVRKCTHTHLSHAHYSAHNALTTYFAHLHACHIDVWLKCHEKSVCCTCVIPLHLALSTLMFHQSLLFLDGHSETTRQRLHWRPHPHDLAVLSRPASAGHAPLRICITKFGFLTKHREFKKDSDNPEA